MIFIYIIYKNQIYYSHSFYTLFIFVKFFFHHCYSIYQ